MLVDKLYPYQLEAAKRMAEQRLTLLADQPGLGKTLTTLGALELACILENPEARVLIVSPLIACRPAWYNSCRIELEDVTVVDAFSGSRRARERRVAEAWEHQDKATIVITNHESIGISQVWDEHLPSLHNVQYNAIIVDESHMVMPRGSDTESQLTQFWRGLEQLLNIAPSHQMRVAVSGTPDRGKLWNRYGTWKFLMPDVLRPPKLGYDQWLDAFFTTYEIKVPVRTKGGREFTARVKKVGNLKKAYEWMNLDAKLMIRRTKQEVVTELPQKQYVDVSLPMPARLLTAYTQYCDSFKNTDKHDVYSALTFIMRAAQFAIGQWEDSPEGDEVQMRPIIGGISPKRDWIIQWLQARGHVRGDEYNPEGGKVVIACDWVAALEWLYVELNSAGITAGLLTGKTPAAARTRVQEDFQEGDLRVVLLSSTMGVGIDLDQADDLIFLNTPKSPDTQEQVEDRIHRVSRMHQVTIWRLRSIGTIDDAIRAANDDVFQKTRELLDGARNIDFERKIIARIGA